MLFVIKYWVACVLRKRPRKDINTKQRSKSGQHVFVNQKKTTWAVKKKNEREEDGRWKMGSCGGDKQRQRLHPPVDQQHTDSIR